MLASSSRHVYCLSVFYPRDYSSVDPSSYLPRVPLDLTQLITLLNDHSPLIEQESPLPSHIKGKKRASPPANVSERQSKRSKSIPTDDNIIEVESLEVPVVKHTFDISFLSIKGMSQVGNVGKENQRRWEQEQALVQALRQRSLGASDPVAFDLGDLCLQRTMGATTAYATSQSRKASDQITSADAPSPLLDLPPLRGDVDGVALDLFPSVCTLQSFGKVALAANLTMIAAPKFTVEEQVDVRFRLLIEVSCALVVPNIFDPVPHPLRMRDTHDAQRRLLSHIFKSSKPPPSFEGETNLPFFFSILCAAPSLPSLLAEDAVQPEELRPILLPFQRRSVVWLLEREGKTINNAGQVVPLTPKEDQLPLFWEEVALSDEARWFFNRMNGLLLPSIPPQDRFLGGILAEEPGLGKTLESIALVLLNPAHDRNPQTKRWDPEARVDVKQVKTTLIITPPSLAPQWADEIALHAPKLKVLIYDGWSKVRIPLTEAEAEAAREKARFSKGKKPTVPKTARRRRKALGRVDDDDSANANDYDMDIDEDEPGDESEKVLDWCSYVNQYDICITTYNVLQQDLGVARAPVIRPRREAASYQHVEKPRSPLILCEWYRVIMDEVQMVGGGKTEEMVSLIPRLSSFAVSGTPARASVSDLIHVLKFLRVGPVVDYPRAWARLQESTYAAQFASLFQRIAIRTVKSKIQDELTIPEQRRFVVPVDLGRVERHVYDQNLEQALLDIGLDARGVAASEGWQVDVTVLRGWLRKLRGICTHPQVGQLQRQNDKMLKGGALKTISEVLEAMKDQNWRNLMDGLKAKVQAFIRRAQLIQQDQANLNRYQHALDVLLLARKDTESLVQDLRDTIAEHDVKGEILKQEAASRRRASSVSPLANGTCDDSDKGKGREREQSVTTSDAESDDLPKTPAGEEHGLKRRALYARLREGQVVLHQVLFLLGDVYHMLGPSLSSSEDDAYGAAEATRKALLKTTEESANMSMAQLEHTAAKKLVTKKQLLIAYCGKGGIRSDHLLREADDIIDILNEQTDLLWQWRAHIFELLTAKLSAGEDGEADGQEYARTLETQGEAETYLQAYAALMADRKEVMIAERTALAAHDAREKQLRHTRAAKKAAQALDKPEPLEPGAQDQVELQPEHEVLQQDLMAERKAILESYNGRAMKSVMVDLGAVSNRIVSETDPEKIIAKEYAKQLRRLIADQGALMDKLEADTVQFRKAFNDRIQYFRQLQELSDSVAEAQWEGGVRDAIEACKVGENTLDAEVNKNRARHRYLEHMARSQEDDDEDEDDSTCILCRCEFARGFITQCAHVFCEGCMKLWLAKKEGKACPVCRVIINADQMQRIYMRDRESEKAAEAANAHPKNHGPAPRSRRVVSYNTIDSELFEQIQEVESLGSYGSKIQTLVRHLLFLQDNDPGAKSIVFSAWADSLHIIEHALVANGISCLRIDQTRGKQNAAKVFRTNPEILVLLLHGERENAGLNVTCASRVFLVESVVQHAFEIQAIARIDRMGQTRSTEVYCYYAEDTVEKNILDLAARQGLSLYTKGHASGTLSVTSLAMGSEKTEIDSAVKKAKQKGDFIFKADDMLAILFPHMFEELEYVLPAGDEDWGEEGVAGPSRLG